MKRLNSNTIRIDSFDEFIPIIKFNLPENDEFRLFRGHKYATWKLVSRLFRDVKEAKLEDSFYKIENALFQKFKLQVESRKSECTSNAEILALAQHYGLPTRLLDWTENPLVALWFAFNESALGEFDRSVHTILIQNWDRKENEDEYIFSNRVAKFIQPKNYFLDDRIKNQQGWFSNQDIDLIPKGKELSGDGLPHLRTYNSIEEDSYFNLKITKFLFSNSLRKPIMKRLEENGITREYLFPDFSKICAEIKENVYSDF